MDEKFVERQKRIVSTNEYNTCIRPQELGELKLLPPEKEQYFLRIPVCVDAENFIIPNSIKWVQPLIDKARKNQEQIGIKQQFCYVTIRHGIVNSIDDDEWHVDGFSTRITHIPEQNYIWCNVNGTEYNHIGGVIFPCDFDNTKYNVHKYLQKFVKDENTEVLKENTIYCMDPYMLHRRPKQTTGTVRTFVRVSFVPIEINDINNTQNPYLVRQYTKDGVKFRKSLLEY